MMVGGSVMNAAGCILIALAHAVWLYYAGWVVLGIAMRLTLYEAAFAALARIGGPNARGPISQITLLGGLAASIFWPVGAALMQHFGWRGTLAIYSVLALATIPLHLSIPNTRFAEVAGKDQTPQHGPLMPKRREAFVGAVLYAMITTLANFLNSGISPHIIGMLSGLGIVSTTAVWISALRGVGQFSARGCDILFGKAIHPLTLNLLGSLLLPISFGAGLLSGQFLFAAVLFSFLSGAGNGIAAITRGTMPLVLFDYRTYGAITGRLLTPSLIVSAFAPIVYAFIIEYLGESAALYLSFGIATVMVGASYVLKILIERVPRA